MKKALVFGLLSFAATPVFPQGQIFIGNYNYGGTPFAQVLWDSFGPAVTNTSVQVQVWFAEGVIANDSLLIAGGSGAINAAYNSYNPGDGYGPGGYFTDISQILPTWQSGDVFTFQLRAPGYPGRSQLWQETITSLNQHASFVPRLILNVPEPSTFALLSVGLFVWRCRRKE
jgi:hypothetical protein